MAQFQAFVPGVEVSGKWILAVIEGMGLFKKRGYEILKQHNIENPVPDGWYSQQDWLDAFKEIFQRIGPVTLKLIGITVSKMGVMPPEIDSIEKAFAELDKQYHLIHRLDGKIMYDFTAAKPIDGIGNYRMEKTGENSLRIVMTTPYPCVFDLGGAEALAQKFKPKDAWCVKVSHDSEGECRQKGDDYCIFDVSWK